MSIDWAALLRVAGVSFGFGVGIVAVFSLGLLGLSRLPLVAGGHAEQTAGGNAVERTGPGLAPAVAATRATRAKPAGMVLAGACFLLCAAAVLYGLWLIIPQFH